jgi:peptidoglycan/xylan/chitin deacetylase (PgdA/CDA1 family)
LIAKQTIASLILHTDLLDLWRWGAIRIDQLNKRLRLAPQLQRGSLIFVFHRITDRPNPFRSGLSVELFDRLCQHLAEHYVVLPLAELEAQRVSDGSSSAVAFTFDDGYADNYRLALPILRRYGLPATVFITTGCMEGRNLLWTSRLAWTLEHGAPGSDSVSLRGRPLQLSTTEDRLRVLEMLKQELKELDHVEREEILVELAEAMGVVDFSGLQREMLTWDQLAEMEAAGFIAGAHTVSHPILAREPRERVREEITRSRDELEGRLRRKVDLFAYPNGGATDYDDLTIEEVRRAGFRLSCTMAFGANSAAVSPYELRRVSVYMDNFPEFAMYLERFFYLNKPLWARATAS